MEAPEHLQRAVDRQKRRLKEMGMTVEQAVALGASSAGSKKQRLEEVTLAAREVMLELLAGDLGFSVADEDWERLVQLTQQHPNFDKLFSFPSGSEEGWVTPKKPSKKKQKLKIIAVDCEMCVTAATDGRRISNALCRVSAVDGENMLRDVFADFIVHQPEPGTKLIDPKTDIHGITMDMISQSKISMEKVQKKMLKYISSDTIVVGHSVSGDLAAMRIDHRRVIDTALIYQRKDGGENRRTPGLKDLTKFLLKFEMPDGHDSTIDAQASMLAAKYAVRNPAGSIIPSALELHGPRVPGVRIIRGIQDTTTVYDGPPGLVPTAFQLGKSSSSPALPAPVNNETYVHLKTSSDSAGSQPTAVVISGSSKYGVEAAIARSCRLRVHRVPKGIVSSDIEKFIIDTAKIVPTAVEQVKWPPGKNKGSCNLTFATNAHAALAFECINSKGKPTLDSIGRAQKTIAVVNSKGKTFKNIQVGVM